METTIERIAGEDYIVVHSDEAHIVRRIIALAESKPDEVKIIREYKYKGDLGAVSATMPKSWFRFPMPPRQLSEETKAKLRDNLKGVNNANSK